MHEIISCRKGLIAIVLMTLFVILAFPQTTSIKPSLRTHAVLINVDDMQKAIDFYVSKLGFEIDESDRTSGSVRLKTADRVRLVLKKVKKIGPHEPTDSQVGLTLQVNDLDKSITSLTAAGVRMDPAGPRKEGVGNAIYIYDPFGRRLSLMHQTIVKVPEFKEPRIYNFGVLVPDMDAARDFYANKLGFVVRSEKYLPKDLPLGHADNTFGFMIHVRDGVRPKEVRSRAKSAAYTIVFETNDIAGITRTFSDAQIKMTGRSSYGKGITLRDPFGIVLEVVESQAVASR